MNTADLSDQTAKLEKGVVYTWNIALVSKSEEDVSAVTSSGAVEMIDPSKELLAKLAKANTSEHAHIFAE